MSFNQNNQIQYCQITDYFYLNVLKSRLNMKFSHNVYYKLSNEIMNLTGFSKN